jgi:hypothetical protein
MLLNSTKLRIDHSSVRSGAGGHGGAGGNGGNGGLGGWAGNPGSALGAVCEGNDGSSGSQGSEGGMGGAGQGGGGGVSAVLFCRPASSACAAFFADVQDPSFANLLVSGQGGIGGAPGFSTAPYPTRMPGTDGTAQTTFAMP